MKRSVGASHRDQDPEKIQLCLECEFMECINCLKDYDPKASKTYYEKNRQKLIMRQRLRYASSPDKEAEYRKTYYEKNRQAILTKAKERYEENKIALSEKRKQKRIKAKAEKDLIQNEYKESHTSKSDGGIATS